MAVTAYGEPLQPMDVDEPQLQYGSALLEVLTCGVCFSDVKTARGKMPYSGELPLPHVCGHEICGRVVRTDPPGALEEGTVVVCYHVWPCRVCSRCKAGQENLCLSPRAWLGFKNWGGFRERIVVPLDRLSEVPDNIDPVHAASMTCALGTGYRAVIGQGKAVPGTRVAVVGLGGVGIHALQVARAAGARVVGMDVSDASLEAGRELGLDVWDNREPDVVERLMSATDGEGVDLVVDCVGQEATIAQSEEMVRAGGRIVAVGYSLTSDFRLPSTRFVLEEVELVGSRYVLMDELQRAIRLVADGKVQMVIDAVRPLEDANQVMSDLEAGKVVGRSVLDVAGVS
ncbi:MAG: zinc-binding dehydrogenase [Actinobacteria bacterium]|nr:zinc-binding dehydrogenase [Actinomycetota bacterium]